MLIALKPPKNLELDCRTWAPSFVRATGVREDLANSRKTGKSLLRPSVIVTTYSTKRSNDLLDCIASLKSQTLVPLEIILVLEPDSSVVSYYEHIVGDARIVVAEGTGLSNARNAGVKAASSRIVAFIDDDAIADRDWLVALVSNFSDSHVVGAGGLIKPLWSGDRPRWFPEELDWVVGCSYKGLPKNKSFTRNPIGCNMCFRRDVFERAGFFTSNLGRSRERLLGSEEAEFSLRAQRAIPNSRIIFDPSAVVYHKVSRSRSNLRYLMKRTFNEGVSKRLMARGSKDTLAVEGRYLAYLLKDSIPSRLKSIREVNDLLRLTVILVGITLVLVGYTATDQNARRLKST